MFKASMPDLPAVEIIKGKQKCSLLNSFFFLLGKLYWFSCDKPPSSQSSAYFFNIDHVRAFHQSSDNFSVLGANVRRIQQGFWTPEFGQNSQVHARACAFALCKNTAYKLISFTLRRTLNTRIAKSTITPLQNLTSRLILAS